MIKKAFKVFHRLTRKYTRKGHSRIRKALKRQRLRKIALALTRRPSAYAAGRAFLK